MKFYTTRIKFFFFFKFHFCRADVHLLILLFINMHVCHFIIITRLSHIHDVRTEIVSSLIWILVTQHTFWYKTHFFKHVVFKSFLYKSFILLKCNEYHFLYISFWTYLSLLYLFSNPNKLVQKHVICFSFLKTFLLKGLFLLSAFIRE